MDTNQLKESLSEEIEKTPWGPLEEHFKRDALFIITDPSLELLTVGLAIARDQASIIKSWLEAGQLKRPADSEVELWKLTPEKDMALFLILQPYVIIKILVEN